MSTTVSLDPVAAFLASRTDGKGHLGTIEVLDIDVLQIDPSYQRDLVQKLVDEIAVAYDPLTAGVVLVSRRDNGDLFIVDGQHKTAGAKQAGNETLLCLVVNGLTPEDEAKLRLAANVKRADTALEKFKARLIASDPVAMGIQNVVTAFGVQINLSPIGHSGINAVGSLEMVWRVDDTGVMLSRVLQVIQDAWGAPEGDYSGSNIFKGIAFFLVKHPEADYDRLIERMQVEGPGALRRTAANHRVALGGSLWLNYYRALVEAYNTRLGDASKLEWKTSGWSKVMGGGSATSWS